MKQHITIEQLNELSEKGKDRYITWMMNKGYITVEINLGEDLPLLSIGQMIEFLEEYSENSIADSYCGFRYQIDVDGIAIFWDTEEELCDALFEAIKEVLEGT